MITNIDRVILVGKNEYKERITSFPNDLQHNELIFNLTGKSIVTFNGKTYLCAEDTIRFLPKGKVREYTVEREEYGECIDIFFDTDVPLSNEAFVSKIKNSTFIANLFKKIFSIWVSKNDGYYFECVGLLYKIFAELQKQDYIPENQYKAIKPAINYIHDNFLDIKIPISDLAAICQMSESYLKKLFVKKYGISPIKYIIQLKINYACDLLRSNLYNVSEASELCGYKNVYYFSRQFHKYMGISPTQFIQKYKSSK